MGSYTDVTAAERSGKTIELLIRALPYPEQIKKIVIGEKEVRFDWRDARYRVDENGYVEEVQGGVLAGTDAAILMRKCIALVQAHDAHNAIENSPP